MNKVWLYSVRFYIKLGLLFYFRRVFIHNIESIPKDKPILFMANHQNALLDALLIATNCGRFSYFLTRAGVFKNPFVGKLLKSLQMLPVYRVRDGWNNITNNNAIFENCSELLKSKKAIVIFPEGSHNLARRVRPLSKGFTRIVFDTLEKYPNIDLQLIPVGLNFQKAEKFPDSASIFFGEPIAAIDFVTENRNLDVVNLKTRIQTELSRLTTNIPVDNYEDHLKKLEALNVNFLNPKEVNSCITSNFNSCKQRQNLKVTRFKFFLKSLLMVNLIVPYILWKFTIEPRIDEVEFKSTFRFAVVITLVPFWLLIIFVFFIASYGYLFACWYILFILILAFVTVKA